MTLQTYHPNSMYFSEKVSPMIFGLDFLFRDCICITEKYHTMKKMILLFLEQIIEALKQRHIIFGHWARTNLLRTWLQINKITITTF